MCVRPYRAQNWGCKTIKPHDVFQTIWGWWLVNHQTWGLHQSTPQCNPIFANIQLHSGGLPISALFKYPAERDLQRRYGCNPPKLLVLGLASTFGTPLAGREVGFHKMIQLFIAFCMNSLLSDFSDPDFPKKTTQQLTSADLSSQAFPGRRSSCLESWAKLITIHWVPCVPFSSTLGIAKRRTLTVETVTTCPCT